VHCRECGYALYRTSTRSSARKISCYRCLGTDAWRYDGHAKCEWRPIRLDLLEHIVSLEIVRLLEDPALIQTELNRRLETARNSSPTKRQQDNLTQHLAQVQKRMDRLLTAYQEDLLSLNELRRHMPAMRQREQRLQDELRSLSAQLVDQAAYLRLAETLTAFLEHLHSHAETLEVQDRQRIRRLLVKEVVVANGSITIRHSIPTTPRSAGGSGGPSQPFGSSQSPHTDQSYLLRPWRDDAALPA
jgi:site-specific DNA recombinase